ncbi:MAG: hypothetical protein DRG78_02615 [Epsilonproteobacteria bacterium]|nr:MAG: hypothetical protein DRG78_02615 [Campylobacterota bacterium]
MIKNTILFGLIISIFSGCLGKEEYGISVPSKKTFNKNSKTKYFIDKKATYMYEQLFIEALKKDLENGIVTDSDYADYNHNIKLELSNHKGSAKGVFRYTNTNIFISDKYNIIKIVDKVIFDNTKNNLKLKSSIEDNKLTINKNYNSFEDLINDYIRIAQYIKSNKKFIEKYGYSVLYLDINSLKENKLVLKSFLQVVDFTPILEKQLKVRGFTLVDNMKDSDKIIYLENLFLVKKKNIKLLKRKQSNVSQYTSQLQAGSIGTIGMNFSHMNGASSSGSAGIGAALFLLSAFAGPSNDDMMESWLINIIETDNPKDYSQALFKTDRSNSSFSDDTYSKRHNAERIIKFIEIGNPYHGHAKVIRKSTKHAKDKGGLIYLP